MQDISDEAVEESLPRKRIATGDGISAGSGSPFRDSSPPSSPRRSIARPTSGQFDSTSDTDNFQRNMFDTPGKPPTGKRRFGKRARLVSPSPTSMILRTLQPLLDKRLEHSKIIQNIENLTSRHLFVSKSKVASSSKYSTTLNATAQSTPINT